MKRKIKILLLTHITADNLGDQTIEICSNGLIRVVMDNLAISPDDYELISQDASFINNQYLAPQSKNQPAIAEELIKDSDLIIFGGAPMFNFRYEGFAERTVRTLKLIKRYSKPVIFSAIGVEDFDISNPVCCELKKELNDPCVKMVTTRDNFDALQKFIDTPEITIAKVSDPAVFSSIAFKNYTNNLPPKKKKIGLFIIRGGAFKDNKFAFSANDAINLWKNLQIELESRGYECEFLTSGSHTDEFFLHKLILEHDIDSAKCVTSLNTPEDMIARISSYDGMVSCRLHPSIISYSLGVPTVSLVWNNKVTSFYKNIGYSDRLFNVKNINPIDIADRLETAIQQGVEKNETFLMSCYQYLFDAIKKVLHPAGQQTCFTYSEIADHFPPFAGSDLSKKTEWKLARIYKTYLKTSTVSQERARELKKQTAQYNDLFQKYNVLCQKLIEVNKLVTNTSALLDTTDIITSNTQHFPVFYNIGKNAKSLQDNVAPSFNEETGKIVVRPRSIEFIPVNQLMQNDGSSVFIENIFKIDGFRFNGWRLRIGIGPNRFLLLEDNSLVPRDEYNLEIHGRYKLFQPGDHFPIIPLPGISNFVAEGDWVAE